MVIAQFNTKKMVVYVTEVSARESVGKVRAHTKDALWRLIRVNIAFRLMLAKAQQTGRSISVQFENAELFSESLILPRANGFEVSKNYRAFKNDSRAVMSGQW